MARPTYRCPRFSSLTYLYTDNVLLVSGSRRSQAPDGKVKEDAEEAFEGDAIIGLTAKVADFGLSLPLSDGATHTSRRFHGTASYMAPEVGWGSLRP